MKRRDFLATVTAAGAQGANDRIRIGLIGTGGRCMSLAGQLLNLPGNEVVATSDAYEPRRAAAAARMGAQAKPVGDYREILDRPDIDAVVIGAPDHWHTRMTLEAVAAGKDVYVEKPVTHDIGEGARLIEGVEKSKRVVATGTQQRSWDHYLLARQVIESGRLGQITLIEAYWYQNYVRRTRPDAEIETAKLDWKKWLGPAREQPIDLLRFRRWRFFWDFGGGIFTDLMTHWIDVIQWYMNAPAPKSVQAFGATHALKEWECPDTVNATLLFPGNFTVVYRGTMVGSLDGGGIVFRGSRGMLKLTRDGFWLYDEGTIPPEGTAMPEPSMAVKSTGDGTAANLRNWLACMRSRSAPNASLRAGVEAARTSHLANQAMRSGRTVAG